VLVLDALSTFAFKTLPPGGGTATFRTWLLLPVEADAGLRAANAFRASRRGGSRSVWLIPRACLGRLAAKALPLAFAPAGLKTVKLTGLTLVRSFISALNDAMRRVFIETKENLLAGDCPNRFAHIEGEFAEKLVPVAV